MKLRPALQKTKWTSDCSLPTTDIEIEKGRVSHRNEMLKKQAIANES